MKATITSKNQITIPAAVVRQMKLGPQRTVVVEWRGDEIVIKPQPDVREEFEALWVKNRQLIRRSFTDDELNQAKAAAWTQHAK